MHAHDGGTEPAFCVVPSAVEGSTPPPVPSGPSRLNGRHYGGPVRDRRVDGRLDRIRRDDSVYCCIGGRRIREAVKGIRPGLLIADRPRLYDLCRQLPRGRELPRHEVQQVPSPAGSYFRGVAHRGEVRPVQLQVSEQLRSATLE